MIDKIIKSVINNIINESISNICYHFCDLDSLWGICNTNKFILTSVNTNGRDKELSKQGDYFYPYYMCFSRTYSSKVGYPKMRMSNSNSWKLGIVRIEIDGDRLNYNFKGKAVNYSKNNINDFEYEDRLLSEKPFINNANLYIKRIDILLNQYFFDNTKILYKQKMLGDILFNNKSINVDIINVYYDENAFNLKSMNGVVSLKAINKWLNDNKNDIANGHNNNLTLNELKPLATILSLLCYGEIDNESEIENTFITLIKNYGYGEYVNDLLNLIANDTIEKEIDFDSKKRIL